jgi:hypothetical protein
MERKLPDGVGRQSRKVDSALPGKYLRLLYDRLSWEEVSVLAQRRSALVPLGIVVLVLFIHLYSVMYGSVA